MSQSLGCELTAARVAFLIASVLLPQEPEVCTHHGTHEPVRLVFSEQCTMAGVVRAGGALARRDGALTGLVPCAQRVAAVRAAYQLHVDVVRGSLPAHRARQRVHLGAAARVCAARGGLAAAGARLAHLLRTSGHRWGRLLLARRGTPACRAGCARGRSRAAQLVFLVQHSACTLHQAARWWSGRHGGRGPTLHHCAARPASHLLVGTSTRSAVPADAVPSIALGELVARVRVRVCVDHVPAGAVRGGALLLLQR